MTVQQPPSTPAEARPSAVQAAGRPSLLQRGRPNLSGDLTAMLESGPAFATVLRGYDRLQVDNYIAWAETELRAADRVTAELMRRLAASEAELYRARQLLAQCGQDRDLAGLSDRVADLLRLAAQEAAALTAADAARAEGILGGAAEQADLIIRRARQREARAAARLEAAERRHAEADAAVEAARAQVWAMLHEAAEERDRLEAQTAARVAQAEQQLAELHSRQEHVRQLLRRLAGQVDAALGVLAGEQPARFSFRANGAAAPEDAQVPSPQPPAVPPPLTEPAADSAA